MSEETKSFVQEEITVEEVEEWTPSADPVDLEWLFLCHGCSGPERTYKYFQPALLDEVGGVQQRFV